MSNVPDPDIYGTPTGIITSSEFQPARTAIYAVTNKSAVLRRYSDWEPQKLWEPIADPRYGSVSSISLATENNEVFIYGVSQFNGEVLKRNVNWTPSEPWVVVSIATGK
jgi:hypothetical protein